MGWTGPADVAATVSSRVITPEARANNEVGRDEMGRDTRAARGWWLRFRNGTRRRAPQPPSFAADPLSPLLSLTNRVPPGGRRRAQASRVSPKYQELTSPGFLIAGELRNTFHYW